MFARRLNNPLRNFKSPGEPRLRDQRGGAVLQPGEMISMYADSIAHARERVREGESIGIVAFGFRFVA